MFGRLLLGLVIGLVVGGLVAVALVAGLHVSYFGPGTGEAALAYITAALTGVLTGLVTGKPIWASGAKIEAGLKAFFGALLATGIMFAIRQWVHFVPDIPALAPGQSSDIVQAAQVGQLPALSLPLLAAVLGGFFELDNTGGREDKGTEGSSPRKRVADGKANGKSKRPAEEEDEGEVDESAPAASKRAKR
jgi:hypothetical protein